MIDSRLVHPNPFRPFRGLCLVAAVLVLVPDVGADDSEPAVGYKRYDTQGGDWGASISTDIFCDEPMTRVNRSVCRRRCRCCRRNGRHEGVRMFTQVWTCG
jgi:hypothetical protein